MTALPLTSIRTTNKAGLLVSPVFGTLYGVAVAVGAGVAVAAGAGVVLPASLYCKAAMASWIACAIALTLA